MKAISYEYKGFIPYGVADMFILDNWTFDGESYPMDVTEHLVKQGYEFRIAEDGKTAKLILIEGEREVDFVRREYEEHN